MIRVLLLLLCVYCLSCNTADDKNFISLLNGENFDGWHVYGGAKDFDGWAVKDGELQFDFRNKKGAEPVNLVTDSTYTNFELSLEWKISNQGNSGIFWKVVEDPKFEHPYQTGHEVQILDDEWSAYIEQRGDKARSGAIFDILAPSKIVSKPADEWNHYLLHIDHSNNVGFLEFNGTEILRFEPHGPNWQSLIDKSSFADWSDYGKSQTGRIGLQDHGGQVAFRNIKIRRLP